MRTLVLIILISFSLGLNAQKKKNEFTQVDKIALQIPDSLTKTSTDIATYINSNFASQSDKARAIYVWITNHIEYDIANMFALNYYQNDTQIVEKVLHTRTGICMHYAELYNSVSGQVGIKSYVVSGYTKQNGFVEYISHAWCASYIDSTWYIIDPTWGSGYVQDSKFVNKPNDKYFKVKPEHIIRSHMPFDPLWQFLYNPVTAQEFYEAKIDKKHKPYFNFPDTLLRYEHESEVEKLESANRRIERNGVKNDLVFARLQHNKREIEYYNHKKLNEIFNSAVHLYNEGIHLQNKFTDYRNKQFTPTKPDNEILEMIDLAEQSFNNSKEKLKEIKNPDVNTTQSAVQLNQTIDDALIKLNEQKVFVEKYIKTSKKNRKALFYK